MQLFDNFEHLPHDYVPNNMFPPIPQVMKCLDDRTVHPVMKDGKHVGYWWNWGDIVQIPIHNSITISLPPGAQIVYGMETPDDDTAGDFIGQKYYNLTQLRSWTLTDVLDSEELDLESDSPYSYVWVEDKEFTYPERGEEITLNKDLCCCDQIVAQLFNFRKEMIKSWVFDEGSTNFIRLTPEESLQLVPGIYYLNVHIETKWHDVATYLRLTNTYEVQVRGF